MQDFDTALARFVEGCAQITTNYMSQTVPSLSPPKIEATKGGRKYVRIVRSDASSRSVHCFVEVATGNVLKAAGWTGPAKGVRGNIFDEQNGLGRMGPFGPAYNN